MAIANRKLGQKSKYLYVYVATTSPLVTMMQCLNVATFSTVPMT